MKLAVFLTCCTGVLLSVDFCLGVVLLADFYDVVLCAVHENVLERARERDSQET